MKKSFQMWVFDTPHKSYMNLYKKKKDLLEIEEGQRKAGYKVRKVRVTIE